MLLITWVLLIITSYFCWQSYRQLGKAQHHIQSLEAQLDTLRATVHQYHTLQAAYTDIHGALTQSHDELAQIGTDLNSTSNAHINSLTSIKLHLDSIQAAYDTLMSHEHINDPHLNLTFSP